MAIKYIQLMVNKDICVYIHTYDIAMYKSNIVVHYLEIKILNWDKNFNECWQ